MRLLPRASLTAVVSGELPLIGSRIDSRAPRGWVSPVEARAYMGIAYEDLRHEELAYLASPSRTWRSDTSIVARALIASALAPSAVLRHPRRARVLSATLDNVTAAEALDEIFAPPRASRARIVCFAHAHLLNLAHRDAELAAHLERADLLLPDGIGVRIAARWHGIAIRHNLNGTDLFGPLCRRAAAESVPLVLIGAREGVAASCAEIVRREHPGLEVPIVAHGYLGELESAALAARVRALGRAVVLVGMGSPRQEGWVWRHLAGARDATVLTVGGLFDMVSGRIPRAPLGWREVGMEWAWRLLREPRRMAVRYLVGNPLFLARAALVPGR